MILMIDNYDSFVYNLTRYVEELGKPCRVVRNDQISIKEITVMQPSHIIISPGPGAPLQAGISLSVIQQFAEHIPILGVCLGHQAIAHAFGGEIIRAQKPTHGKFSLVQHNNAGIFSGLKNPFVAGRYHSLAVARENFPECLQITATADEEIMGLQHKTLPIHGVQFHPESILTEHGHLLLNNFISI